MNCAFIATLGTRDVQIDEQKISEELRNKLLEEGHSFASYKSTSKPNLRKIGHLLSEYFDKEFSLYSAITLPIIEPCIQDIINNSEKINLSLIYLIATNQKSQEETKHHQQDTITISEFLKKHYLPKYFENTYPKHTIPMIKIIELRGKPNDYDEMLQEVEEKFNEEKSTIEGEKIEKIFGEVTGGTPQISFAVVVNSARIFGNKVVMMYKSESGGTAKRINIINQILEDYEKRALKRLAERYDFDAIAGNRIYSQEIRNVARCASYRLNFDFERYKRNLQNLKNCFVPNDFIPRYEDILEESQKLLSKDPCSIFRELYWNAQVKWERDEGADFIGRAWRLYEGILQYEFSEISGCKNVNNIKKEFQKWIEENLKDFIDYVDMDENFRKKHGLDSPKKNGLYFSTHSMLALLDYLSSENNIKDSISTIAEERREKYKDIVKIGLSMKDFTELRNKCIIAHGFEPVSKEIIESIERKNKINIREIMKNLLELAGFELEPNYYEVFKKLILKLGEVE